MHTLLVKSYLCFRGSIILPNDSFEIEPIENGLVHVLYRTIHVKVPKLRGVCPESINEVSNYLNVFTGKE